MNALTDRLMARIEISDEGCWLWTGALTTDGYPHVKIGGRVKRVHRVMYELFVGPISAGLMLDHECHNRSDCAGGPSCDHRRCIRPDHLAPTDARGNMLSSANTLPARQVRQTHCARGHPLSGENLYREGTRRHCRVCRNERSRSSRSSRRGMTSGASGAKEKQPNG